MTTATVTPAILKPVTFGKVKQFIEDKGRGTNPGWTTVRTGKFATDSGIISYEASVGHANDPGIMFGEKILELKVSKGEHRTILRFFTSDDGNLMHAEFNYSEKSSVHLFDPPAPDELPNDLLSWVSLGRNSAKPGDMQQYLRSLSILSNLIHRK